MGDQKSTTDLDKELIKDSLPRWLTELNDELMIGAAINNGYEELQTLLNDGANINAIEPHYGKTALHYVSMRGKSDCVKLLLDKGANINATDHKGQTALHLASWKGSHNCVEILLNYGANINATDNEGKAALHCSSIYGKPDCVDILLKHKADHTLLDGEDKTAYQNASKKAIIQAVFHKYGIHQ